MATINNNRFGELTGWNQITINILGRDVVGIKSLSYSDEWPTEVAYGAGAMPVGKARKNYKAKCEIELLWEEVQAIQSALAGGLRIQQLQFDVIVQYEYGSEFYKDIVRNCNFNESVRDLKQGEGEIWCKMPITCISVDWNVK
ncbi:hypothetical protein SAMN05421780_101545 [Flexibacter flexilis DSM 6793]|uniref:Phage tail tube protein n=1 Tax=Flexibacter flexilis DSM 6793 TaxID=927664 RepID=A0A1I1DZJ9_9BACT|nr:hypothetical protein [Flexibacter flexilis]SFB80244.1 hypothetical protein SAMN05421780_101545 [Flexibacter flexilis DSM 6793]